MITDRNKGIDAIAYNHLNLPETVTMEDGTIRYVYDAGGNKLEQQVFTGNAETPSKVLQYAGEFIYETTDSDPTYLKLIQHEEGRITFPASVGVEAGVYQYHLKDHLGNARLTFTSEPEAWVYKATMESEDDDVKTFEETFFENIAESRFPSVAADYDDPATTADDNHNEVSRIDPMQITGPAASIEVGPGDKITASVWSYYESVDGYSGVEGEVPILAAISSTFESTTGLAETAQIFSDNHSTLAGALVGGSFSNTIPAAYLSYVYFDKDFNFKHGDMIGIGEVYPLATNMNQYYLELTDIEFDEPGYVMVYLSYEGTQHHVLFDDFTITHTESAVVQSDDYYPFGLTFNSYQRIGNKENRFKYNSKELVSDLDLGWYDYQARWYDPALGRWHVVDPAAELMRRHSPYNYAFDNPIRFIDPDGMVPTELFKENGEKIGEDENGDDGKVSVVSNKVAKEFKKGEIDVDEAIGQGLQTTKAVLEESIDVLDRTESNGGFREEASVVDEDGNVTRGEPGDEAGDDNIARVDVPFVEGDNNTFIHSHLTGVVVTDSGDVTSSSALDPGPDDPSVFENFEQNVIVGRLGLSSGQKHTNGSVSVSKPGTGAAFFDRNSNPTGVLRKKAIKKIIQK